MLDSETLRQGVPQARAAVASAVYAADSNVRLWAEAPLPLTLCDLSAEGGLTLGTVGEGRPGGSPSLCGSPSARARSLSQVSEIF